jgi:hypothetical protein
MRWWSSTSEHVATFDWHRSAEVRDVDTITSRLLPISFKIVGARVGLWGLGPSGVIEPYLVLRG